MVEIVKPQEDRKPLLPCPYLRRVAIISQEPGFVLIGLCGRKKDEKHLPALPDFDRPNKCCICTGWTAKTCAEAIPAVVRQSFDDMKLLQPASELTYVRVARERGAEGIADLETRWEELLEKIKHP